MPDILYGQEKWQEDILLEGQFAQGEQSGDLLYSFQNNIQFRVDNDGALQMINQSDKLYYFVDGTLKLEIPTISSPQVYYVTHNEEGKYLPHMLRSFISFSYGGKNIEDFSLISVIDGDRMSRQLMPNFEDHTSTYEVIDGQFYWGTHFTNNTMTFNLATDGMTELDLDAFLNWFQPGQIKELILAEHPNRAIMARVATPPQMDLLPFEEKVYVKIAGEAYETSTTKYKGSITLEMVMDEPFWYAKYNLLDKPQYDSDQNITLWKEYWVDANGNIKEDLLQELDALKVIKEDLIPLRRMLKSTVLLGDNSMAGILPSGVMIFATGRVAPAGWTETDQARSIREGNINRIYAVSDLSLVSERESSDINMQISIDPQNGYNIMFPANKELYLYYCGTAPSYPTIRFSFAPIFDSNSKFITNPANTVFANYEGEVTEEVDEEVLQYNTIFLESTKVNDFNFTLPSYFYFYNILMKFLKTVEDNTALVTIREYVRENIKHSKIREIINTILDSSEYSEDTLINDSNRTNIINAIYNEVKNVSVNCSFNLKTGECIGTYMYNAETPEESYTWVEDIGDMVYSNHFVIEERNYPTSNGYIIPWSQEHPLTTHRLTHNCACTLNNFSIEYKNLYY